jgi:hypothetical protein
MQKLLKMDEEWREVFAQNNTVNKVTQEDEERREERQQKDDAGVHGVSLSLKFGDGLDIDTLLGAEESHDDGKTHSHLSGGHGDGEEHERLSSVVWQAVHEMEAGKADQREVRGAEHQFKTHEHNDDVATHHHAGETDGEQ